jgi:hypothetical protein
MIVATIKRSMWCHQRYHFTSTSHSWTFYSYFRDLIKNNTRYPCFSILHLALQLLTTMKYSYLHLQTTTDTKTTNVTITAKPIMIYIIPATEKKHFNKKKVVLSDMVLMIFHILQTDLIRKLWRHQNGQSKDFTLLYFYYTLNIFYC